MRRAVPLLLALCCAAPLTAQQVFLDRISAYPGETVRVYSSTSAPTQTVHVVRSRYFGIEETRLASGPLPGGVQPVEKGSFAWAVDSPSLDITGQISLEAWVRPIASTGNFAGILMKYRNPGEAAYGIYLMPSGQLSFYLGETGVFNPDNRLLTSSALPLDRFTHVVATFDGIKKRIYLDGRLDVSRARTGGIYNTSEPLRVGSFGSPGTSIEGDIDSAAVYSRALTPREIEERFEAEGHDPGVLPGAVAQYEFEEMVGTTLADETGNGNDLTLFNHATRGQPGPGNGPVPPMPDNWTIRFSNVDSYNPDWEVTYSFEVQPTWDAGFHAIRVSTVNGSIKIPFIVKPSPGTEARIAVLAASNTWTAYNNWSQSLYETNPGGSINRYVGLLQPSPNAQLDLLTPGAGYSPRTDAERFLYRWLDEHGYEFDLYSDLDLHRGPDLFDGYDVVIISGHSEYWSWEMIDHLEAHLDSGGYLINLSGNTMWTRVTFNADFSVMEGRKHPWGGFPTIFNPGERWHSQAGQVLGGTMRCIGRPEHEVIGTGYGILTSNGSFGSYRVVLADHWVFQGTDVWQGRLFGTRSLNGNAILGHEFDVVVPEWSPKNVQILARGAAFNGTQLDITNCNVRVVRPKSDGGDMVYFTHPSGGAVFGAPTIAFGGSLMVDNVVSKILQNVLDRFLGAS